ncbi:MAG: hypothetical protein ACLFRG_07445 [Desulfococcaceae bacterium]
MDYRIPFLAAAALAAGSLAALGWMRTPAEAPSGVRPSGASP